jgi:hypothetical protein
MRSKSPKVKEKPGNNRELVKPRIKGNAATTENW